MATGQGTFDGGQERSGLATGLYVFTAILMIVGGVFHGIAGLAAVLNDDFFVQAQGYSLDLDVTAWGWLNLLGGGLTIIVGMSLLTGAIWARLVAMFLIVVASIIDFIHIPLQPAWSLVMLTLNGAIFWALLSFGDLEEEESRPGPPREFTQ